MMRQKMHCGQQYAVWAEFVWYSRSTWFLNKGADWEGRRQNEKFSTKGERTAAKIYTIFTCFCENRGVAFSVKAEN